MTSLIAGMEKYRPDPTAPDAIAISCDCDKCRAEQLTADYNAAIDETFIAYQTGRLDLAGFESARFTIHTTYREAVYGLGV